MNINVSSFELITLGCLSCLPFRFHLSHNIPSNVVLTANAYLMLKNEAYRNQPQQEEHLYINRTQLKIKVKEIMLLLDQQPCFMLLNYLVPELGFY